MFLQAILQDRKLAVAGLSWNIEVDDEKDPAQKSLKDGLQRILRATPYQQRHHYAALDAIWYGRHAVQHRKVWRELDLPVVNFQPAVPGIGNGGGSLAAGSPGGPSAFGPAAAFPPAVPGLPLPGLPGAGMAGGLVGQTNLNPGMPAAPYRRSHYALGVSPGGDHGGDNVPAATPGDLPVSVAARGAPAVLTRSTQRRRCWIVQKHQPVHGDSIGHKWDGTPYILVYTAKARALAEQGAEIINPADPDSTPLPPGEITLTTGGSYGLVLRDPYWRDRFLIHSHLSVAAEFQDVDLAEAIHGAGVRDVLYWFWWLKNESLEWVTTYFEPRRPGYQPVVLRGGEQEELRRGILTRRAAEPARQHPRPPLRQQAGAAAGGVERIETPIGGAEALLAMKKDIEDKAER